MEKRCGKPWLLLWLLPYLMLSLFSGISHNHGSALSHHALSHHTRTLTAASSARSSAPSPTASASRGAAQVDGASGQASASSECLACHWASSTLALLATSALAQAPPPLAVPWPRTISSLSKDSRGRRSIRGPPLS